MNTGSPAYHQAIYDAFTELPENVGSNSNRDTKDGYGRFIKRAGRVSERGCGELSFSVPFSGKVAKWLMRWAKPAKKNGPPGLTILIRECVIRDGLPKSPMAN